MATWQEHVAKAEHNEQFLGTLDPATSAYLDWFVTVVFYVAVHYLRALGSRAGFPNVGSYGDLEDFFRRVASLHRNTRVWKSYRRLKDDSRDARYEMRVFTPAEVVELRDNPMQDIKVHARRNLGV
jgi:hypothetical protein